MKLLVTGGAGFIGSNFIRYWLKKYPSDRILNFDKLTYAGHLENLRDVEDNPNYQFVKGDICDESAVKNVMEGIDVVVHFAAESHVDRSVIYPFTFVNTNVLGTSVLLQAALDHKVKRFHHVSTDEVFGQLAENDPPFSERTPIAPRTPYAASKASSDLLVWAYFETYGLPITITNCSNNFGPYQDPEKVIPRFISNLMEGKTVPLFGEGANIRDWLYVDDHNRAVDIVIQHGKIGERYCVGGGEEISNLKLTHKILELMGQDESMIEKVPDRLGHDFRYAIDSSKIKALGWDVEHTFDEWIERTVAWYKNNEAWWRPLKTGRPVVDRVAQKAY